MKRILVIGCPGAGKSYFSRKLGKILNLPVIHLDAIYWQKDKTSISKQQFVEMITPFLEKEKWIIEGNYHQTLKLRLKYATDVFFLKIPIEICIEGIKERINQKRDDIPWIESAEDADELIEWIKDYENRTQEKEEQLLSENKHINVHTFLSREEMNQYLNDLKINRDF